MTRRHRGAPDGDHPESERVPLLYFPPLKLPREMSEDELREWGHAVGEAMAEMAAKAAAAEFMEGPSRPDWIRPHEEGGRPMAGTPMDYARILLLLQRWARIRVDAGGHADIIGPAIRHSALLYRMLGEGKDPLPLPPPKLHRRPWYALIEERGAVVDRDDVRVSGDAITIGRDAGWKILETVVSESSFIVTYPGRAIGRWSLVRTGEGDGAAWRLARIPVGPGTDWEHHVAHVARRLARFFADPDRHQFVIVEGGAGFVQVCTFGRPFYLDFDLFLQYEAALEVDVFDPETFAAGLRDRLRALGFDRPDDEEDGNYYREGPAPVDARTLAEDMLVVLAEAYGLTPADPVRVKGAVGRDTVSRTVERGPGRDTDGTEGGTGE